MLTNKTFTKGTVIFTEGQWENCFYDIRSGKVGIYSAYGTEKEQLLTELSAGRYFGEMGLIEGLLRSATAVALEDTETAVIDAEGFRAYFESEPEKVVKIMQNLSIRLRELSAQYNEACDTMREYLAADKEKKPRLMERLFNYIKEAAQYASYADASIGSMAMMDVMDPIYHVYFTDHDYWF